MKTDYIHIVCLDAPSPPNYGGAIDMYYKIIALHSARKKIILHYFNYKEGRDTTGLENYCEEINAYKRTAFLKSLLSLKPYIVSSRIEPELIHRLNRDDYPILLEGIHCTGIIPHLNSKKRIVVRIHNDEAEYYRNLYDTEKSYIKKLYFLYESMLLKNYQETLLSHPLYAFISTSDLEVFKKKYNQLNQAFIPSFIPWQTVSSLIGKGDYCLYHGNISISENYEAALWLAENVFSKIDTPLIIAGKDAKLLQGMWADNDSIQLIDNPTDSELTRLIQEAHINVLPSMNNTGVKLKLLHALLAGRFCISNYNGLKGSNIENFAIQADSAEDWISAIKGIMSKEFGHEMIEERQKILSIYDNAVSAERLISQL